MKLCIAILLVVVAAGTTSHLEELEAKFQNFKLQYGKIYRNQVEETKRYNIFTNNLRSIEKHNVLYEQGTVSYRKGINKFTDMTQEEFQAMLRLSSSHRPDFKVTKYVRTGLVLPDSVDWRNDGQVTEVKEQGNCGACWAFSVTGSTEAAYKRKSGKLVSLSEQQLVDCAKDLNEGCLGGMLDWTFPYVVANGLQSEESYPYIADDGTCNYSSVDVVTKISDFKYTDVGTEDDLLDAIANIGPISTGVFAFYLYDYESGIYEDKRCTNLFVNHGVVVIGYGSENGKDYWIVKNSWGKTWGEDGYFRILRGNNECGIGNVTAYPIIN